MIEKDILMESRRLLLVLWETKLKEAFSAHLLEEQAMQYTARQRITPCLYL